MPPWRVQKAVLPQPEFVTKHPEPPQAEEPQGRGATAQPLEAKEPEAEAPQVATAETDQLAQPTPEPSAPHDLASLRSPRRMSPNERPAIFS